RASILERLGRDAEARAEREKTIRELDLDTGRMHTVLAVSSFFFDEGRAEEAWELLTAYRPREHDEAIKLARRVARLALERGDDERYLVSEAARPVPLRHDHVEQPGGYGQEAGPP
ncbi:hypothetical protein ACFL59_09650, partial [Planctomycetota bacterium]